MTDAAWTFLYAVAICKGAIFFVVLGVMLVVDRTKGRIGRAAIWSVFSTQSNDFALGLPIFQVNRLDGGRGAFFVTRRRCTTMRISWIH